MKKKFTLLGILIVMTLVAAISTFTVRPLTAKSVGWGYFDALVIGTNPYSPTASITSAGALTVTSLTNTGAVGGSAITATTSVTSPLFVATGPSRLYSRTKAQINALATPAVGDAYYCSDCAAVTMCLSTGTVIKSFVKVDDRTAVCD